jgi:di/tricarboxylate transporter
MGFLDKYIQFRKRMARFRRLALVILYLLVASASMRFILCFPATILALYESFGLTPAPGLLFLCMALQHGWPVFLLVKIGLFTYFVLYRKKNWPTLLWLCFMFSVYAYFIFSFPAIKFGVIE